jgi:hypothetical protein
MKVMLDMTAGFYAETHAKLHLQLSEGEALGVRKLACAFNTVNIFNALRRQPRCRSKEVGIWDSRERTPGHKNVLISSFFH